VHRREERCVSIASALPRHKSKSTEEEQATVREERREERRGRMGSAELGKKRRRDTEYGQEKEIATANHALNESR